MIFTCKYLSNSSIDSIDRARALTWNVLKTIGFLFIRINLHLVLNTAIDLVVVVSSFDLWFRILQNIVTFRLDRSECYIKGVARTFRSNEACFGMVVYRFYPFSSLLPALYPFCTRFAHNPELRDRWRTRYWIFARRPLFDVSKGIIIRISMIQSDYISPHSYNDYKPLEIFFQINKSILFS